MLTPLVACHNEPNGAVGAWAHKRSAPYAATASEGMVDALAAHGDAFHYYAQFRPWEAQGSAELVACAARRDKTCDLRELSVRQADAQAVGCRRRASVFAAASELWWAQFRLLPALTRRTCASRILPMGLKSG